MTITSTAHVTTDRPERLAKQLVTHLGRKVDFVTEGPTPTATFGASIGSVTTGTGSLTLVAAGPRETDVARVEGVLARHLEKFAHRHPVQVSWTRTITADLAPPAEHPVTSNARQGDSLE